MATNEKLTQRAFFCDILTLLEGGNPIFSKNELMEYASGRVEKLDNVNAARRNAEKKLTAKAQAEAERNDALRTLLTTILSNSEEPLTGGKLAEELEVSKAKVAALAKPLVETGAIVKSQVKGEKGKIVAYSLSKNS